MKEPLRYPGYEEEAAAAIGVASRHAERLEETRQLEGEKYWVEELGRIVGSSLPHLMVSSHYNGEVARISLQQVTPALQQLMERPDLMPAFLETLFSQDPIQQVISRRNRKPTDYSSNPLTDIQTKYRDGWGEEFPHIWMFQTPDKTK